ncbi:MAG: hypothetical protein H7A32_00920 [Deltaproteobacteria bacterium]|nr:hypothetical protein [Deltaproteobacteria bacterium]
MARNVIKPILTVEWHDPENSGAVGWLVIDRFVNGVAGGGVFMHTHVIKDEVQDLAYTMSLKNTLQTPMIGGGNAGIRYRPTDKSAREVLGRFLQAMRPFIKDNLFLHGDLNTNNATLLELVQKDLGIASPMYSLARVIHEQLGIETQIQEMHQRILTPYNEYFKLDEGITGFSVAECVKLMAEYTPKVLIQGFGHVGSSLGYFLESHHSSSVVGISDYDGYIYNKDGIEVEELLKIRQKLKARHGGHLIAGLSHLLSEKLRKKYHWTPRTEYQSDEGYLSSFIQSVDSDVFCPCATRYQITSTVSQALIAAHQKQSQQRPYFVISGANNVFAYPHAPEELFKAGVISLPEWVSNCGNSLLFVEAAKSKNAGEAWMRELFFSVRERLHQAILETQLSSRKKEENVFNTFYELAEKKLIIPQAKEIFRADEFLKQWKSEKANVAVIKHSQDQTGKIPLI